MKKLFVGITLLLLTSLPGQALTQLEGQDLLKQTPVSVGSQSKKGLVVVFLSAKCPCSNSHVQEVKELSLQHPDFQFVAVHSNVDEDLELTQPYFEKAQFSFPVIQDKKTEIADQLKALKTPHAFIYLADGTKAYEGGVSNSKDCERADRLYLREALQDLQAQKPVRTPEGRTLGCVISRGEKNVW